MNNLQAQNKRLADVQRHDVAVADKYLQSTSKAYKGLVALINQFVLDHRSNSAMLLTQKPNKRDLKRLNGLVDDLDDNLSKQAKKRLKLYLSIAEISLNYYLQAIVGIQNITLHNEYSKISKTSLNEDYSKELEFQLSQLSMQRSELDQKKLIDFEQHEATIWDSHDIMIAAISASLVKMLRNIRRDELLSKMLPQAEFRRSILCSKYEPIKRVSGDLPINAYYQSEQYKMEQAYRDHSSRLMHTEALEIFKSADIKTVTIVNEFVPCSECKSYVGQTYLLDEAPDLPIHYNCRCRLMAIENGISGDDLSLLLGVLAGLASNKNSDEKDNNNVEDELSSDEFDEDKLYNEYKESLSKITTQDGVQIKELTTHFVQRIYDRGLSAEDITDALEHPLHIQDVSRDNGKARKYFGSKLTIVINPDKQVIITGFTTKKSKLRKYGGMSDEN